MATLADIIVIVTTYIGTACTAAVESPAQVATSIVTLIATTTTAAVGLAIPLAIPVRLYRAVAVVGWRCRGG